jgi:uncharacterized protein YuzE
MEITYNTTTDLLYIRMDNKKQQVVNKQLSESVVLDVGEGDTIIGIEILAASKHVNLHGLLPVQYKVSA